MLSPIEIDSQEFASTWAERHLPSYGVDWERAIAFGIDVTLLLENMALTPAERLARLQGIVRFHEVLRNARNTDE
jgi:hypothetical protein